jgi:hypothetical protein
MKAFAFALLLIAAVAATADDDRELTFFIKPDKGDAAKPVQPPQIHVIPKAPERRYAPPRYYICPEDETLVRVTHTSHTGDVKCPIDGTVMRAGRGPTSAYFLLQ